MNIRGQTGLDEVKQVQIEQFIKFYKVDVLNCQEINIENDSFQICNSICSSYQIIPNNASNKYGTCCFVANHLPVKNLKYDTNGRIIIFDIGKTTFGNVYLPSGNDPTMRHKREEYFSETIPKLLIHKNDMGCIGGDWNSIENAADATKNPSQKVSSSLKRLVKAFSWFDSYRHLYPDARVFSRYYENKTFGDGATRIDRQYVWGQIQIIEAKYVGVAFSDHQALIVKIKLPQETFSLGMQYPKARLRFKANPDVVRDPIFQEWMKLSFGDWFKVKRAGLGVLPWWELIVKPGIRSLLIKRGKELNVLKHGQLNLLLLRQAYLVKKLHEGFESCLTELKIVQQEIQEWYGRECEKIKLQSKCQEINSSENVRIYHHELHSKNIKKSTILKLDTENGSIFGHHECARYLEQEVGKLLLYPAELSSEAQDILLKEVKKVFTLEDNHALNKAPSSAEVKESLWTSNLNSAPGTDGLTNLVYKQCWDVLGESLVEVAQEIHNGNLPTLSQRTSLMVYGAKSNKPLNSTDPKHKRRISLLNSDFKIVSGIYNARLRNVATHTLNQNQFAMGKNRNIHHGISKARDAIFSASCRSSGCGILDNDYMAAFDYMVLKWVFRVLEAKGLDFNCISRLKNLYSNHLTVVVVNNISGKCYPNNRWSIRQGDRPSSILFCYGLDPHLDWLENRLQGIPLVSSSEVYKLIAYVDDVKPSITSMHEFNIVDQGSALFEAASGCKLHRDPNSGKVKFLPLGRWKGTLLREDLPVRYVALSEHLDMVGVKLKASFAGSRKLNCDELQEKVRGIISMWRGGKFMPLVQRSLSVNCFCLSKVWFRSATLPLRVCDFQKINSLIKSWVYADQLEKPNELILYRNRKQGGLGLLNIKFKSLSLLIRTFLESSINPKYIHNEYHEALYKWFVMEDKSINRPVVPPYYDDKFFDYIKQVKNEGILNISTMTSGQWYRHLVEKYVTCEETNSKIHLRPMKVELKYPAINWESVWTLAVTKGLPSDLATFLWRMLHDLLPIPSRLFKLKMANVLSDKCNLCNENSTGDLTHSLLLCPYNNGTGELVTKFLSKLNVTLEPQQVVHLDFHVGDHQLASMFLVSTVLQEIWKCRKEKKPCRPHSIRATLEAKVNILRKSRYQTAADTLLAYLENE